MKQVPENLVEDLYDVHELMALISSALSAGDVSSRDCGAMSWLLERARKPLTPAITFLEEMEGGRA